jgi:uncharacterized RDD family membrane protein YckC
MRYCTQCGQELADGARFCASCGTAADAEPAPDHVSAAQENEAGNPTGPGTPAIHYAGLGRRFAAHLFDGLMVLVAYIVIGSIVAAQTGNMTSDGFEMEGGPAFAAMSLTFLVALAYFAFFESSRSGRTLGKRLLGIKVTTLDGGRVSFGQAVTRNLLRLIDGLILYLPGIVLILMSDRNQRLGERWRPRQDSNL